MDRRDVRTTAFLALAAAAYYASYLTRLPFLFGDEGYLLYVADLLSQGAAPYRDVRLFSYLPGLFYLFAPLAGWDAHEILLARAFMAAGLVAKTLLFYGCARRLTGRGAAGVAAAVVLLVPGPWHKFYVGLLALWVLRALISALDRPDRKSAAHAGLAVGVAAVLRIDVAIVGAALLVAVLAFMAWRRRLETSTLLAGPATAVAVTLPVQLLLLAQGVLDDGFRQWLSFAGLVARRSEAGLRLPPPSPEGLLRFDWDAWIFYGALLVVLAYLLLLARRPSAVGCLVGLWALGFVPQYAFERPDVPHVTQYGFAFLLPAAVLAGRAMDVPRWRWTAATAACLAAALFAGRHLWHAEGGAAAWREPASWVVLSNGFAYPAAAGEPTQAILETIVRESAPHERIAVLPYSPGVAFATRRRLHGRDVYLAPHAMTSPEVEDDYVRSLAASPPRFVVYQPDMSFNGAPSGRLDGFAPAVDAYLRARFSVVEESGGLLLMEPRSETRTVR